MQTTKIFKVFCILRQGILFHFKKYQQSKSTISLCLKRFCSKNLNPSVEHIVLVSTSTNIFVNLALEDWLFEHEDLLTKSYLLMWRNSPAVVIGRHQNLWTECNLSEARRKNVDIVRRRSGGGAVYHDEGNVNFSFIMSRQRYNRKANLELVVEAVTSRWDVDLTVNKRDDLILNGTYKVSGTAAKLSGNKTYHHFTFLLNVDKDKLNTLLLSKMVGVQSKATESIPAYVMNVREAVADITFDDVVEAVGSLFLRRNLKKESTINYIKPTEELFPGLDKNVKNLKSWEWVYGNSPKCSVFKHFSSHSGHSLKIDLMISKGKIENVCFDLESGNEKLKIFLPEINDISLKLTGLRYDVDVIVPVLQQIEEQIKNSSSSENENLLTWLLHCVKQCF